MSPDDVGSPHDKPRKARHLIDFDAPPRVRDVAAEQASLERVKRWVMSVLVVTTLAHLAVGLVIAAVMMDDPKNTARIGLCVIAGAFGVIGVALARAIHGRSPLSPWLVAGTLPTLIGVWLLQR